VVVPTLGQDTSPAPATGTDVPVMPARLYEVPERLAPHLGREGYRWHRDVAAEGLAIGTTAAVFPVNEGAVMAVSALDGTYRGLDLPGFDPAAYFRFDGPPVALSPDGERLAYTWNPRVAGELHEGYLRSGVRIVDLDSGQVTSTRIKDGFGVFAHDFSWSPDGQAASPSPAEVRSPPSTTDGRHRGCPVDALPWSAGSGAASTTGRRPGPPTAVASRRARVSADGSASALPRVAASS
jgi:hypothetical protein